MAAMGQEPVHERRLAMIHVGCKFKIVWIT